MHMQLAPAHVAAPSAAPSVASLSPVDRVHLAASLLERIHAVRSQHQRETGRKLSTDDAIRLWAKLETEGVPIDGDAGLDPADLDGVSYRLAALGYSREAIEGVLADIGRCGTAECSGYLDTDEDRAAIEELIPDAPEHAWRGARRTGLLLAGTCR